MSGIGLLFFIFASCHPLNRPPVFANYFENYMVVKEVMKEMFSVIFGPKNILGSQF